MKKVMSKEGQEDENRESSQVHKSVMKRQSFIRNTKGMHVTESGLFIRPDYMQDKKSRDQFKMTEKLYKLMQQYVPKDMQTIQKSVVNHVQYTLARTRLNFKSVHCYLAVAHSIRDRLIQYFNDTYRAFYNSGKKRIYYFSLQYLIGRCLQNAVINIDMEDEYKKAMMDLGYQWEKIADKEIDPALGNGGLGRLAACFLDSIATLNYPCFGYGIRYDYGIFKQIIQRGNQIQVPDFWLSQGYPWQIQRIDVQYKIQFYGKTRKVLDAKGKERVYWEDYQTVVARAYDIPIPGYATFNTIGLRLWKSIPANEFDFNKFNQGDYFKAIQERQQAEYITSVLYPNDSTEQGKQLRLKQEYLLVCASLQDIIRRDRNAAKWEGKPHDWKKFAERSAIQLNDTHPSLAIVQLLRIMIDVEGIDHEQAWEIIYNTFSYTNHTVLPEALQKWSVQTLGRLLPRHLELIYLINHFWLNRIAKKYPDNGQKMSALSLVEESNPKKIRMANLCIVGSHTVNGVAAIHSQLLKKTLFKDFYQMFPEKFINVTNGVTPRRWIICANPLLADLYTEMLKSDEWVLKMSKLRQLQKYADDQQFQSKWKAIKRNNKKKLADWIKKTLNVEIDVNTMFDVQVKRIHEYKRQFMNILYVVWRYLWIKKLSPEERKKVVPRTVMFSGKAAPGYDTAKKIIKMINEVSYVVNSDRESNSYLKVLFLPNYCVSNAEIIIPATQLSQHISTAGTQASGTSNMKFVMNGGLIIGTMDGANVQIYEEVGKENIFIFGAKVEQIETLRHQMQKTAPEKYIPDPLKEVLQAIRQGKFGDKDPLIHLVQTITNNNDQYLVCADFLAYMQAQNEIDQTYRDQNKWTRMSILNALRTGKFSSDRTIQEYVEKIWKTQPCKVCGNSKDTSSCDF